MQHVRQSIMNRASAGAATGPRSGKGQGQSEGLGVPVPGDGLNDYPLTDGLIVCLID